MEAQSQSSYEDFRTATVFGKITQREFNQHVLSALVIIALLIIGHFTLGVQETDNTNVLSYWTNIATDIASIIGTALLVNRFQANRDKDQLSKELLSAIKYGGPSNAAQAISLLRAYEEKNGWYNGERSLLANADLSYANLKRVQLNDANLEGADLSGADLENASLGGASLQRSRLIGTNMRRTNLVAANLQDSILLRANLLGAVLSDPVLGTAMFSEKTVLPDAASRGRNDDGEEIFTKYYNMNLDLSQLRVYIDPTSPNYWDPCKNLPDNMQPTGCEDMS